MNKILEKYKSVVSLNLKKWQLEACLFYSHVPQQRVTILWGLEEGFKSVFKLREFSESFHLCPGHHQLCLESHEEEWGEEEPVTSMCVLKQKEKL